MPVDKSQERVLGIPTAVLRAAGLFQGFSPRVEHYLPRLLDPQHLSYRPRSEAETDLTFKQLIPYIILRWQDQLFHYARGKRSTESRLRDLRSIGVGGHIRAEDAGLFGDPYAEGMRREVAEEVYLETPYQERCVGLINDDSTPVGQVHLGIVHVFELAEPRARRREQVLTRSGFAPLLELYRQREEFETWSQFALEALAGSSVRLGMGEADP